ncbi:MAG TPA: alpha/beta hydrolase [Streptosporangiaceae bacterium]
METGVARVNGIRMYYRRAGQGPLIVLVHGWPQHGHCWRHLMGPLAETHTVVAPDLRGYGRSEKPATGYDKRTMAADLHELLAELGFTTATVIAHDRGARVAHRWALDHPEDIDRLILLDIIPTREMWRRMDADLARRAAHWLFHLQPDLPELIDPAAYVRHTIEHWSYVPLPDEDIAEYVRAFQAPGAMRGGLADYRASFPDDAAADDADAAAGRRLTMPVRLLWGEHSFLRSLDPVEIWREYAEDVAGEVVEDCGHFLPEERPREVLAALARSLA